MYKKKDNKKTERERGREHKEKHGPKQNAKLQFRVGSIAFGNYLFSKC